MWWSGGVEYIVVSWDCALLGLGRPWMTCCTEKLGFVSVVVKRNFSYPSYVCLDYTLSLSAHLKLRRVYEGAGVGSREEGLVCNVIYVSWLD